jgi:hypothetical protein
MSARQRNFFLIGDIDGGGDARLGTNRGAWGRVGYQRCAIRRIHGGFLRDMGASLPPGFEPPAAGPGPVLNRSCAPNGRAKGLDPPAKDTPNNNYCDYGGRGLMV